MTAETEYELYDHREIMGISFLHQPLLNLNPLPLEKGDLYPGDRVYYLGGRHASSGFKCLKLKEPIIYVGLYHPADESVGPLALFAKWEHPKGMPYAGDNGHTVAFYCYHWSPESQSFIWSNSKSLTARIIESGEAVFGGIKKKKEDSRNDPG